MDAKWASLDVYKDRRHTLPKTTRAFFEHAKLLRLRVNAKAQKDKDKYLDFVS
jgi:hypothetical protein